MTFRELRIRADKSIPEVAESLGISQNTYKKYECSSRLPRATTLPKMASVYECSIADVMKALKHHSSVRAHRK